MTKRNPKPGPVISELVAELKKVWPEAAPVELGQHNVFQYHNAVPAHTYESIVEFIDGPRLIQLTARDSFDRGLAQFLLDSIEKLRVSEGAWRGSIDSLPAPASGMTRLFAVEFPNPWRFDCIVVVPPKIAKRFEQQSRHLAVHTYWVAPSFAGEFRNGEDGAAFWHQLYRKDGWNVDVICWNRTRKTKPVWD
jgi:hypothetical protein